MRGVSVPLPLEGVRVLDLTGVWAGSFSTVILADLGAEVLKAENQYVWQPLTRGSRAHPTREEVLNYPSTICFPDNDPGERSWNYCSLFVGMFRNKRSFTVDLRRPEGRAILGRVVAQCDAVLENSTAGTMEKLGITYEWLREQREDIIFVRASGYGLSGEYSDARALGIHLESVMGHQTLRGYEGADPIIGVFAADYVSGTQIALAVLMALWHRNNTGEGQFIELAQAENAAAMFAQAYLDHALTGNVQRAVGNRSIYAADGVAPCGVYPCLPDEAGGDGADRWIAITVASDAEWAALRGVMGEPEWAASPELATGAGRAARQDLLDGKLASGRAHSRTRRSSSGCRRRASPPRPCSPPGACSPTRTCRPAASTSRASWRTTSASTPTPGRCTGCPIRRAASGGPPSPSARTTTTSTATCWASPARSTSASSPRGTSRRASTSPCAERVR